MPDAPRGDTPEPAEPGADGLLPAELRAWMNLLAAAGAVEQSLRAQVKDSLGVSHDEFLILCLLADHPEHGLRMTQIAQRLGRPKTRLTYQVACLHNAGLVTRGGVRDDRRGIQIALTEKTRQLLAQASRPLADAITQAVAHALGPQSNDALRELISRTRTDTPDPPTD